MNSMRSKLRSVISVMLSCEYEVGGVSILDIIWMEEHNRRRRWGEGGGGIMGWAIKPN
jgi:hypothetical protein